MNIVKSLNSELFDIFVLKEEYIISKRDKHGRFLYAYSSKRDITDPIVSRYLIDNKLLSVDWPDNHNFAACLTHDVDFIYPGWKYTLFTVAKHAIKLNLDKGLQRFINRIKRDKQLSPFYNFKEILKLEECYGGNSSFYFKAVSRDSGDWTYDIETLDEELGMIIDMGGEVGLHGGYYSYNDALLLREEKDRLEKIINRNVDGIRMHYLRFKVPDTWRLLADLDFKYDTTLSYPDMPGFKNGMCHPFKPFDLNLNKEIDILEIPLTIMDVTLRGYMRLNSLRAWKIIKKLIDITEKYHGVITILWHNRTFDEIFYGGYTKLYKKILSYLYEKNAWLTNTINLYEFWMKYYG